MTLLDDDEAAIKALNLDRLPTHIVDKRVTELMDLTGKKAFVTGAGGGWRVPVPISHLLAGRWNRWNGAAGRSRSVGTSTRFPSRRTCRTGIKSIARSAKRMTSWVASTS